MWKYMSLIGPIYIKYLQDCQAYGTIYNDVVWKTCNSPQALADNVYCHCIGCSDWDSITDINDVPTSLSEWEKY